MENILEYVSELLKPEAAQHMLSMHWKRLDMGWINVERKSLLKGGIIAIDIVAPLESPCEYISTLFGNCNLIRFFSLIQPDTCNYNIFSLGGSDIHRFLPTFLLYLRGEFSCLMSDMNGKHSAESDGPGILVRLRPAQVEVYNLRTGAGFVSISKRSHFLHSLQGSNVILVSECGPTGISIAYSDQVRLNCSYTSRSGWWDALEQKNIYLPPWSIDQFQSIGQFFSGRFPTNENFIPQQIAARCHRYGPSWYAVFLKNEIQYGGLHFHQESLISELLEETEEGVMQKVIDHPNQDFILHWELPNEEKFRVGGMPNRVLNEYVKERLSEQERGFSIPLHAEIVERKFYIDHQRLSLVEKL